MTVKISEIMSELRVTTKAIAGLIVGLALAMQIDVVKNFVTPLLANHPKLSSAFMGVVGLGLLLQNPKVREFLHLDGGTDEQSQSTVAGK